MACCEGGGPLAVQVRRPLATVPALSVSASGERARPAAACSGIRLRVSGRRGPPSPPGGGCGLVSRSLSRRRSSASAPGDARALRRGLAPRLSDEASLWLVPSTPVARVFLWIGATEGRPELTGLVITASFSGIAGASLRLVLGSPPSIPAWLWWASGDRPRHPSAPTRRWRGFLALQTMTSLALPSELRTPGRVRVGPPRS